MVIVELKPGHFIDADSIVAIQLTDPGYDVYARDSQNFLRCAACNEFETCPVFEDLKFIGHGLHLRPEAILAISPEKEGTAIEFKDTGGARIFTSLTPEEAARRVT